MNRIVSSMQRIHKVAGVPKVQKYAFSSSQKTIEVIWINKNGSETKSTVAVGTHIMEAAHRNGIELEGACEGACACSTCHVILEKAVFKALPEASEKEEDMLDQAYGLTPTSRLGCQVVLEERHNGIKIKLPKATRNFYVVCLHCCVSHCLSN